jgi:hypothetical protein
LFELHSWDATTVRLIYTRGESCEEHTIASAYLPYDSDEPPPTKELRNVIDYCCSRKSDSSLGVMPLHTTYYGGALAPIPEEKASWNIW